MVAAVRQVVAAVDINSFPARTVEGANSMKELEAFDNDPPKPVWPWVAISSVCLLLIFFLKWEGIILTGVILLVIYLASRYRPDSQEAEALVSSIVLSREDIEDVLVQYDKFLNSQDADAIADRTLHRPALADEDCNDPDICAFHFLADTSRRYVSRVNSRLKRDLSVQQLEVLLLVTDKRALELKEAWLLVRKSAHRLGGNYQ